MLGIVSTSQVEKNYFKSVCAAVNTVCNLCAGAEGAMTLYQTTLCRKLATPSVH